MGFEEILQNLEGSVTELDPHDVKISRACVEQIRKRVSEAVVRHILTRNEHFKIYLNDQPENEAGFTIKYNSNTGRITATNLAKNLTHAYGILGILKDEYEVPFFGEVAPSNLEKIHPQIILGFQVMEEMFERKDGHAIIFGNFNHYNAKRLKNKRLKYERHLQGQGIREISSKIMPTTFDHAPRKIKELMKKHGSRMHLVEIGEHMSGSGELCSELFGYAKKGKMYDD